MRGQHTDTRTRGEPDTAEDIITAARAMDAAIITTTTQAITTMCPAAMFNTGTTITTSRADTSGITQATMTTTAVVTVTITTAKPPHLRRGKSGELQLARMDFWKTRAAGTPLDPFLAYSIQRATSLAW